LFLAAHKRSPSQANDRTWCRWHNHPEVGVMRECMKFIAAQRPRSFILENVLGISDSAGPSEVSPLDVVMKEMKGCGYHVHSMSLNTNEWINCSRVRPHLWHAKQARGQCRSDRQRKRERTMTHGERERESGRDG
jgi:hypothetical protein